jgi:hypothetical protein
MMYQRKSAILAVKGKSHAMHTCTDTCPVQYMIPYKISFAFNLILFSDEKQLTGRNFYRKCVN